MSNRSAESYYDTLLDAFKRQAALGRLPDYADAAAAAGVQPATARRIFHRGRSGTANRGPLPAIATVLGVSLDRGPFYSPPPVAATANAPKPTPPKPQSAAADVTPLALAPSALAPVTTPPPAAPSQLPAARPATTDTTEIEDRALGAARHAVEGVAALSTVLLSGLQPLAQAVRRQLEEAARTGTADAKYVAAMLESLATSLGKASNSLARLVEAQSVTSGRVQQRISVARAETTEPAERLSDDEIRRRTSIVLAALAEQARELGAQDVTPAGAAVQDAEVLLP